MDELRRKWEVPSITHFVATFHKVFHLPELHVEELENAFLASCVQEGSDLLNQLLASLLSGYYSSRNIEFYNYESSLRDCLHQKWQVEGGRENPLAGTEFRHLSLSVKVEILYLLCMYRLEADDVSESIKQMSSEEMRIEPVGQDDQGATYWNFNDERLYKETKPDEPPEKHKKKKKHKHRKKKGKHRDSVDSADETPPPLGEWSLVCATQEEWENFVKHLKKSHHKQDKKLRKIIVNDFLPLIPEIIVEKEKAMKKRLLEMLPKRESNRLARKRAEVDEQKALMAELEKQEKEEEMEKKREAELRRKQELARQRDERNRAREEEKRAKEEARQARAMRAMMREHNVAYDTFNSADDSSMSEDESEETDWDEYNRTAGGTHISSRQRRGRRTQKKTGSTPGLLGPKEYEKINKILYQIQRNSNCWPFLEPVTKEIAPDYFDIIDTPMDISVLRRKSTRKEYLTRQQFIDDFNLIVTNCIKYNGETSEYGSMALKLKDKFDSLIEKSFPPPQTGKVQQRPTQQISRSSASTTRQLSDSSTSESEESQDESEAASSDSSYNRKYNRNPPKRNKTSTQKGPARKVQRTKKQSVNTTTTTTEDSSDEESEGSDEESPDLYNFVMSHNPSQPSRSLNMSQSQQILTDMPLSSTNSPARVFGIARRNSGTNVQGQTSGKESLSTLNVTPTHTFEKSNQPTPEHASTLQSPVESSSGGRSDRTADIARWMGKSTPTSDSNGHASPNLTHPINGSENNVIKIQAITRPQQPFQGLVAQLKRSSVDNSLLPSPPYKRVA